MEYDVPLEKYIIITAFTAAAAVDDIEINKYIIQEQIMEILLWLLLLARSVALLGC